MASCGNDGLSAAEAAQLAEPHLSHFATFDRWARRAVDADPAFRDSASMQETLFAPIRRETSVRAVWIHRDTGETPVLSYGGGEEPPKNTTWANVVDDRLGRLFITTAKLPDAADRDGEGEACVLVRRTQPASNGAPVTVTVAYRAAGAEETDESR